jgi:hypothetical protein
MEKRDFVTLPAGATGDPGGHVREPARMDVAAA